MKILMGNNMTREEDLSLNTIHCPECGCAWFRDKGLHGLGSRTCCDCRRNWYTYVSYDDPAELRKK